MIYTSAPVFDSPAAGKNAKIDHCSIIIIDCACGQKLDWPIPEGWQLKFRGRIQATCACGLTYTSDIDSSIEKTE